MSAEKDEKLTLVVEAVGDIGVQSALSKTLQAITSSPNQFIYEKSDLVHPYLAYIINNYTSLSELTVFVAKVTAADLQTGDVLVSSIERLVANANHFDSLELSAYEQRYGAPSTFEAFLRREVESFIDEFVRRDARFYVNTAEAANMCIRRANILSRPLDFYKQMAAQVANAAVPRDHLDAAWYYVFNLHKQSIMDSPDYVVVGSGLSGAVMSEQISLLDPEARILIIEKRDHLGGNCYDYIDEKTGIRVSKYGPHIFHTNDERVWSYVNKFSDWFDYRHKVYGRVSNIDRIFPIPINITSVNILCGTSIESEEQLRAYLADVSDKSIVEPANSEEFCLQKFGKHLYELVFKHYTKKQWDKYPSELDVELLKRIPLRFDHSEGYFTDKYQALPTRGYTPFIGAILNRPNILGLYASDFIAMRSQRADFDENKTIIFTGPIDHYYKASAISYVLF